MSKYKTPEVQALSDELNLQHTQKISELSARANEVFRKSDEQLMREYLEDTGQQADFANITALRILDRYPETLPSHNDLGGDNLPMSSSTNRNGDER